MIKNKTKKRSEGAGQVKRELVAFCLCFLTSPVNENQAAVFDGTYSAIHWRRIEAQREPHSGLLVMHCCFLSLIFECESYRSVWGRLTCKADSSLDELLLRKPSSRCSQNLREKIGEISPFLIGRTFTSRTCLGQFDELRRSCVDGRKSFAQHALGIFAQFGEPCL